MKNYYVTVPFAGFIGVQVEAESKEEAIDKAFDLPGGHFDELLLGNIIDHYEWDLLECICKGNVLYAPQNEVEVEEINQ